MLALSRRLPAEIPEWRLAELIPQHRCFRRLALSPVETRITRTGDEMVRTALYEAANVLLSRIMRFSKLKRWGMDVAKRRGSKRAKVALARKIGVILHRMCQDLISIADTISGIVDKLPNWVETAIESRVKRSEAEMCGKISERFGELMGRLAALDPTQARAARGEPFRFANEKADSHDEPVAIDLPNWRRGNGTVVN
jgi:hypothetical protein